MLWHKYMTFTSRSWQEVILIWTSERKSLRQYRIALSTPFSLNVSFEIGLVCLHSTRKLILIAYLHQLSCHSGPLKGFHCFRVWFSSPRLPVSPSPMESPVSRITLHKRAGCWELEPFLAFKKIKVQSNLHLMIWKNHFMTIFCANFIVMFKCGW